MTKMISFVRSLCVMAIVSLLAQCVWAALPTPVAHWSTFSEGATGDAAGKFTVKAGTGCTFTDGKAVTTQSKTTANTGLLVEWENGQVPAGSLTVVVKYSGYVSSGTGYGFNSLLATKWGDTYEEVVYANAGGNNVGLSANVTTSDGGTQNLANPTVAVPAAGYMVVTMSTDGNYGTSVSFRGAANASFLQATYQSGHRYGSQAFKGIKIGGTQSPIGKYHRPAMTIEEVTLYTAKLTADDFNDELPRTASFTVSNETDWSTKTIPTTVDTAYARANTSFANNADYKQTLASGEATVVNVTDVSNGAYIYGLHAFDGQNGIGAITRDIYLMVSGGAPAVISGGEDASWNSSTKTIPTGNVLVNITGDTTVDYVYGAGLGGGTGNGLAKIIGNVGIVVDGNAQVKGSLIAGWQSRHNTIPEVTGNTSILIKNVQTHYQDATLSTDNQRCEQGWIAAGGIHKTNGGRSKVGGNASVTVQLGDDATGTFNKHIVAGGIGIGGGDGQNVTGDGMITITAPNAVVFAKNVVGGGHSTGNNARIGGNTSVTLNGGTYTGTIYAGGDHSAATVGGTATLTIMKGDFSKATLDGGTATGAKALSVANAVIDPSKISGFSTVEIKAGTTFALPAGTASGASYALGTLTADESVLGEQLVAVGARQRKMTVSASDTELTFTDVAGDTAITITAEKIAELGLAEMAQGAVASFVPSGNNIAANCTFIFPEGVTDYVAWAEGDTQVFLAKKTRSVSIKFSPATANEGVIAKTDSNVGGYPIAGYFWNHSKMYTDTGTGTTEIMKVKDGTGAELADTRVFYYMPNMYDVNKRNVNGRNKQTTGNGKLTYSYFDDSVRVSTPTFPYAVTQSGFEDCSLPQTPAGKLHWEVGIKNIPYQVFDLYIYQASDQDGTISLLPIAVKANEGEWKYYAGDGNGKTIPATATDRWNGAPYCDSETMVEGTNYIRYRLSKAALGLGENDRIESIYLSHPNVSNGRLGLAGIQIVEVENDGYFTRQADTDGMSEEDKNWTAAGSWKNSSGTAINWPTEPGTAYVNINADEVAEITVDGVIEADEVKLTSSSATEFKFLTKESLATVNTPNENPDYILKAPVDATGFNGQLYLQSRIDGTITLGQNAGITFVSNVEGEETTAYSYNFIGSANITKVGPGSFLVPESMYTVPFAISAGSLRYDYSGATAATMTRGLSGAGKVVKTGSGEIVINAGGTFTGGTTINGGTITLGANNALGAQGANVTVNAGGTLDINGKENHGINLTLAGGTLKNSSTAGGGLGQVHLRKMIVTADSVLDLTGRTGVLNNGWDATTLTLNDKKLTKTGTGEFLLCNTTVSSGTIRMVEGGIRSSGRNAQYTNGASNLTAVNFEIAGTGITFAGFSPTIKSLTFEDNGSIVAAEDNDATITVAGTVSGTGTANKLTLGEGATVDGSISVTGALAFGNTLKVKAALGTTVFTLGEGVAAPATMPAVTIVDAEGEHTGYTLKADGTALKVYAAAKVGDQVYATIESAISAAGDTGVVTIIDAAATIPSTHAKVTTGDVVTLRAIGGKVYYKSGDWTDGCTVWADAAHTSTTTFDVTDTMVFTAAASVYPDHGMTSALKIEVAANTTVNIGHEGAGDWTNLPSGSTIELGDGASVVFQYWGNDAIQGTAKLGDVKINGANGTFSYNSARTNPPTFGAVSGTAKLVLGDGQSVTATSFETMPISGVAHKHVVCNEGVYSLALDKVTITIPEIANTTVTVTGGTPDGNTVTVDYGTEITVTYTPDTNYNGGGTITMTATSSGTIETTGVTTPALRQPTTIQVKDWAVSGYTLNGVDVTPMTGDTIEYPATLPDNNGQWGNNGSQAKGYPVLANREMNWKADIGTMTIGNGIQVYFFNGTVEEDANITGEGTLSLMYTKTLTGDTTITSTVVKGTGVYAEENPHFILSDGATLKVKEELPVDVTSAVDSKKVVFNEETLIYSLATKAFTITISPVEHTTVTVNGEASTAESITVDYGTAVTIVYTADTNYKLSGEGSFSLTNVTADQTVGEGLSAELDVTTIEIPAVANMTAAVVDGNGQTIAISKSNTITVTIGSTFTVTYTPKEGYIGESVSHTYTAGSDVTFATPAAPDLAVARIGTRLYKSVTDAILSAARIVDAETDITIVLLQNVSGTVDLKSSSTSVKNPSFTLDLNGKTWENGRLKIGKNDCHLTIKDSSSDGSGLIRNKSDSNVIYVSGSQSKLTIESGRIVSEDGSQSGAVYMRGNDSKFEMTGGSITAIGLQHHGVYVSYGSATISGGSISSTSNDSRDENGSYAGFGVCLSKDTSEVEMTGGSISSVEAYGGSVLITDDCATDFAFGKYSSALLLPDSAEKYIKTALFAAYQDDELLGYGGARGNKINSLISCNKIKLITDIDGDVEIERSLTFDLNDHNIISKENVGNVITVRGTSKAPISVTFTGEGRVSNIGCAVGSLTDGNNNDYHHSVLRIRDYAEVTIENGTYINDPVLPPNYASFDEYRSVFYSFSGAQESSLRINGGAFECRNAGVFRNFQDGTFSASGLNVSVYGGTFVDFNPAYFELGGARTNVVASGYISVYNAESNSYTVKKAATITIPTVANMTAAVVDAEGQPINIIGNAITVPMGLTFKVTYTPDKGYIGSPITTTYEDTSESTEVVAPQQPAPIPEPKATVTTITKEGLDSAYTFTMDANESAATSDYYGDWKADFVVTFDHDVAAESLKLSGQHDGNGPGWADLTIGDVAAGDEIKLISMVAAQLGYEGLTVPYSMIRDSVRVFNCGVKNLLGNVGTKMTVKLVLSKDGETLVIGEPVVYTLPVPEIDVEVTPSTEGIAVTIPAIADSVVIESEDGAFDEGVTTIPSETGVYTVTAKKGDVVLASDTIGVINVEKSETATTHAVAVPFENTTVATLLNTSLLNEEDTLIAYVEGKYRLWTLADGKWVGQPMVDEEGTTHPGLPDTTALARGTGVWVTTAGEIVTFGKYTQPKAVKPGEGTSLLGNINLASDDVSNLVTETDNGDQIIDPSVVAVPSVKVNGEWKHTVVDDSGLFPVSNKVKGAKVKVGHGFFYVRPKTK